MKSMKFMKMKKFHHNFSFMPFMLFMVQRKNDDITTYYQLINFDGLVKSSTTVVNVIPAKAGNQEYLVVLDPRLRGGDAFLDLLRLHHYSISQSFIIANGYGAAHPMSSQIRPFPTARHSPTAPSLRRYPGTA
ncbi:MAG: hypothetical protein M0036_25855 [Desulfobacteraceae bacterium]|nr:hypothetical protein [Desulfobacteraceae bacterium]